MGLAGGSKVRSEVFVLGSGRREFRQDRIDDLAQQRIDVRLIVNAILAKFPPP